MPRLKPSRRAALPLAAALAAASCGPGEPKPDPAAVDAHLNRMIADEEVERRRLVEAARNREDVRENEMEERADNYSEAKN